MPLQNHFVYTVYFSLLGAMGVFYNRKTAVIWQLVCAEPLPAYPH